ncbi:MAG TPA: ABC transporter ATP-binding protein, partial [Puia sp.]|nr:ABC transporter ATP-binding protein [Puia sp.]
LPNRVMEVFALLGLFVLVALNRWAGNGGSTIIVVGAFMAAAYKIIPGIVRILNLSGQIKAYEFTITDLDYQHAGSPVIHEIHTVNPIHSVRFEDIAFRYNHYTIFNNINFNIERGDFLGIAGDSGKGKTTILNLLLGFLSPTAGKILINDKVVSSSERQQFWQQISYIKQQPFLIHDTISKNIALDEEVDYEKLGSAIQFAGLTELINSFPEKLNKVIAENGRDLSGGQRQRIAIARALYKDASFIILDEPFSELDENAEISILQHCKLLSQKGKLIVLITHNSDSLLFCNKIISLDAFDLSLKKTL